MALPLPLVVYLHFLDVSTPFGPVWLAARKVRGFESPWVHDQRKCASPPFDLRRLSGRLTPRDDLCWERQGHPSEVQGASRGGPSATECGSPGKIKPLGHRRAIPRHDARQRRAASPFEPREANNRARCLLAAIWARGAGIVHKEQVGLGIGRSRSVVRSNPRVDLRSESHGPR
jgi:hypothetical protein